MFGRDENGKCLHCGAIGSSNEGQPDPCLGMIAGVTNACCGHGDPDMAYMCFQGGLVIEGFTIKEPHYRSMSDVEHMNLLRYNKSFKEFRELPPESGD